MSKVIACDFDGTLFTNKYPDVGKPKWRVINKLKRRKWYGDKIILWTCREGDLLDQALRACWSVGLEFDAVNCNLPERVSQYGSNPRKLGADEYWDDLAKPIYKDFSERFPAVAKMFRR